MAAQSHDGESGRQDPGSISLSDETSFQRDLLAVMATLGKSHGLGIKDFLEDEYQVEIHHGRLYPNLDDLVDKGMVTKGTIDKRTNSYKLTDRGRRELVSDTQFRENAVAALEDEE